MDPEEIARKELERMEKKKRKQEKKMLRNQARLQHSPSLSINTQSSDSDSGLSQSHEPSILESSHLEGGHSRNQTQSSCDQTGQAFYQSQRNTGQKDRVSDKDSPPEANHNSGLCPNGRASGFQKLNPFSVESLLSDSPPKRKSGVDFTGLSSPRSLIGKGHFLLYPITQPLGFIVPQTALKNSTAQETTTFVQKDSKHNESPTSPKHYPSKNTNSSHVNMAICKTEASCQLAASPSHAASGDSETGQQESTFCEPKSPSSPKADSKSRETQDCQEATPCTPKASISCEDVDMD